MRGDGDHNVITVDISLKDIKPVGVTTRKKDLEKTLKRSAVCINFVTLNDLIFWT